MSPFATRNTTFQGQQDLMTSASPASFDPFGQTAGYVKRVSLSAAARTTQTQEAENARRARRRESSGAAFQLSLNAELTPYIVVDESMGASAKQSGETNGQAHVVRRRIWVEPAFSRQEKTAGTGEEQFRQTIFDQGITDESLVEEVRRGISNEYELGTPQPLRNVHDYVDYSSESLAHGYIKEHVSCQSTGTS